MILIRIFKFAFNKCLVCTVKYQGIYILSADLPNFPQRLTKNSELLTYSL